MNQIYIHIVVNSWQPLQRVFSLFLEGLRTQRASLQQGARCAPLIITLIHHVCKVVVSSNVFEILLLV